MKTISSSRWIRPCSRRGSGKSAKWSRIEAGLLGGVVEVASEPTGMVWTSLKRSGSPGGRWYKSRSIPGQTDWTRERVVVSQSAQTSQHDAYVLVLGATGSGKTMVFDLLAQSTLSSSFPGIRHPRFDVT